jgi:DNA polymerase-3 subunit epsilon
MKSNNSSLSSLGDTDDVRILRPVHGRDHWPREVPPGVSINRIAVLDLETSGICARRHKAIEFAVAMLAVDDAGKVVAVEGGGSTLIDPGYALGQDIEQLTGITNAMVRGNCIDAEYTIAFLSRADFVLSFNASFDRAHLERLLPTMPLLPWACALRDVDWRSAGFEPGPQAWLLAQAGFFNPQIHRAASDVQSLCTLLDHKLSDGSTIIGKLLDTARQPAWRLEAKLAPYGLKDDLKAMGYSWSSENRIWHKHVRNPDFQREYENYIALIGSAPAVVELPATARYRPNWTWRPA